MSVFLRKARTAPHRPAVSSAILTGHSGFTFATPLIIGGGGPAPITDVILPEGVPAPLAWFTPRHVELNETGEVTRFLNQGANGAANDATPLGATPTTMARIAQAEGWGGRDVIELPLTNTTNGYVFGNIPEARTVITLTTYKDGAVATFGSYDGLVSGGEGSALEVVGNATTANLFFTANTAFKNGIRLPGQTVLPLNKSGLAVTNAQTFSAAGTLFRQKNWSARFWRGLVGDILIFQTILTDQQIADIHATLAAFYAQP